MGMTNRPPTFDKQAYINSQIKPTHRDSINKLSSNDGLVKYKDNMFMNADKNLLRKTYFFANN